MILTLPQFHDLCERIARLSRTTVAIDFETTGLKPQAGAKAFLVGIYTEEFGKASLWLNGEDSEQEVMGSLVGCPHHRYTAHNAKFEMMFLTHQFGVEIQGQVWDTEVMARVEKNNHLKYGLQSCAELLGLSKHPPMLEWLKQFPKGKARYQEAPPEILIPYVEQDAYLSWFLANHQLNIFQEWDNSSAQKISPILKLEMETTKSLFAIEWNGLLIDTDYCEKALDYEKKKIEQTKTDFSPYGEFKDSAKRLRPLFDTHRIHYDRTPKGNPSFSRASLQPNQEKEIPKIILEYRDAKKRASSYWEKFLDIQIEGKMYPNIRQAGADTFRMSITDPAAQTWPTDEDNPTYPIRRAFLARPGCVLVSMDYAQMEFRLMCDEAEDMKTIQAIQKGLDVHQEVADMAQVSRSLAKNGRFAKLYGCGIRKLAETLQVSEDVARRVSLAIDKSSPGITSYSRRLIRHAEMSPYAHNWAGRRYYFNPGFAWLYPNYRIQGGCSEILRIAINEIQSFLKSHRVGNTFLMLPIHDELLLNVDREDLKLIPEIKRMMIGAHRSKKFLSMDVGIHTGPNYHDQEIYHVQGA